MPTTKNQSNIFIFVLSWLDSLVPHTIVPMAVCPKCSANLYQEPEKISPPQKMPKLRLWGDKIPKFSIYFMASLSSICIQFLEILKAEYFCPNICKHWHWSLKINGNTRIKGVLFSFSTLRYILSTLSITMIISCWSSNL